MTDGRDETGPPSGIAREPDLVLARAHLRFGSLGLARAELETLAGRDLLDDEGIRDLAEARWRTGDMQGAGEAAVAYLEVAPDDVVGLVIAAEAQADLGRPGEARKLAGRAMELTSGSLDPIFAGMRRSSIWPVDQGTLVGPVGVLFDELHPGPIDSTAAFDRRLTDRRYADDDGAMPAPFDPALPAEFESGPGLWDDQPALEAATTDPVELFHRARVALEHGETESAATCLILALRSSRALAPAVLDLLGGRSEPILLLVRGDAEEIVGREIEAGRDRAAAAAGVGADHAMADPVASGETPSSLQAADELGSAPETTPDSDTIDEVAAGGSAIGGGDASDPPALEREPAEAASSDPGDEAS